METLRARHLRVLGRIEDNFEAQCHLIAAVTEYTVKELMDMEAGDIAGMREEVLDQLSEAPQVEVTPDGWNVTLSEEYTNSYGQTMTEVKIRLPKVKDLIVRGVSGEYERSKAILSRLSEMTPREIDGLLAGDFRAMVGLVQTYITVGDDTGQT